VTELPSEFEKVKNEWDIIQMTDHPNIVRFIEAIEDAKYYCIVMEYMEGGEVSLTQTN
jgi:serine/threonine protein kinase